MVVTPDKMYIGSHIEPPFGKSMPELLLKILPLNCGREGSKLGADPAFVSTGGAETSIL